ncbi:unnamed protein product [Clonostachys byssicola]|uniref:Uncharacterized protein n=1 Tax=Clonostachys byssicola TaxID=160290 RepID=A0A9N9UEU0_9HYPO|nr:unnamed protein product [Clonostachys byssicola]
MWNKAHHELAGEVESYRLDLFLSERQGHYKGELKFRIKSMIDQTDLTQKVIDLLLKKVDDSLNLSVWGMTQFQIAAEWVAVLALPLLTLTLFLVAISYIVARKLDDRKMDKIRARTDYLV